MTTTRSEPTVQALHLSLRDVKNWKGFAIHLPGIDRSQIDIIELDNRDVEKQKTALYAKWLQVYPIASWDDLIKALELAGEKTLANQLRERYTAVSTDSPPEKKSPVTAFRVFQLLHHKSAQWNEIGRALEISSNDRLALSRDPSLTDNNRLERIITIWIESRSSPVTWEFLISALRDLHYNDVIHNITVSVGDSDGSPVPHHDTVTDQTSEAVPHHDTVTDQTSEAVSHHDTVTDQTSEAVPHHDTVTDQTSEVSITSTVKQRKDYDLHLKRAAAKGTVTTRISSLGILGAAGTGKTSIKKLLTYQKADDVYNSTPALQTEKYVKVDTRASEDRSTHSPLAPKDDKEADVGVVKLASHDKVIASAGNIWRLATQETLLERIASCVEMAKQQEDNSSTNVNADELLAGFSMEKRNDPTMIPHTKKSNITADIFFDTPSASTAADQVTLSEYNKVAKLIIDHVTPENLKQLGITHFVSISDTGGQAAFLDIAPFLLNFNSVNLILLKLTERLEDPAQFFYTINGKKIGGNHCEIRQISTKSLVHSFVSTKSQIQKPRIEGIKAAKPQGKPKFMILGTHYDIYKKAKATFETVEEKNQSLESNLSSFKDCVYKKGKIYKALDTRARDDDTLKLASVIQTYVTDNHVEAEIPVAWYILELAMDKVSKESLIFLSTLTKIGTAISEMPPEEVEAALVYFHNLQVCLFYPEVVPNVVFTSPQYLFDRISMIIAFSYNGDDETEYSGVTDEFDTLKNYGKFHIGLMDIVFHNKPFCKDFSEEDFLKLLDHLFIVSSLKRPNTNEPTEYFMPCVLAEHPNPCEDFIDASIQVEPLLLKWRDKSVPNGLFPSLTTNIQADKGFNGIHFTMSEKQQQYRNKITLDCQALACEVTLIECNTFVGIAVRSESLQQMPNTCVNIREAVFACMENIVDRFKDRWPLSFALPDKAYICKVQLKCLADPRNIHFCYPTKSSKLLSCEMDKVSTMSSKDSHTIWWGKSESPDPLLNHSKQLTNGNLFDLLRGKSSEWDDIGREMGISHNDRTSFVDQHRSKANKCLECVLNQWIQEKTPMWSEFIYILEKRLKFIDVAKKTREFLRGDSSVPRT